MKLLLTILISLITLTARPAASIVSLGGKGDSAFVNTEIIQKAIDRAYRAGGGEIIFAPGRYLSGALTLRAGVWLVGETIGARIIAIKGLNKPLITVENGKYASISNLTIDGNMFASNAFTTCILVTGSGANDNSTGLSINHNLIINAGLDGIQLVGSAMVIDVSYNDIKYCNRYCINNAATDNNFSFNDLNHGNVAGFLNVAGNTRITGGKIIGCGMYNSKGGGMVLQNCGRCTVMGVEFQDNYYSGMMLDNCEDMMIVGIVSDNNGVAYRKDTTQGRGFGFKILNSRNSYVFGMATSYRVPTSQLSGLYMERCTAVECNIKSNKQEVASMIIINK